MSGAAADKHEWLRGTVLAPLEPGPLPIIPKALWAEIQEWLLAWKHADALREAELDPPGALLLYGPTGTGKTSLARAILKYMGGRPGAIVEAHNIITSALGGSGQNVAQAFALGAAAEALLVIEEIDGLAISRHDTIGSCATEENRVTIAIMRHLEEATFPIIATTNYREKLDVALLRRFELQLEVPLLDAKGRAIILRKILGRDAPEEMIALPLTVSIRLARRIRRNEFLAEQEAAA